MTERENHLMFCKFCSKSSKSLNLGIICSLTNKQADFFNKCDAYIENSKSLESEKKSLESQIDEKYDNMRDIISYVLENIFGIYFFDSIFKSKYDFLKKEQTQKLKIQNSYQHIKILILVFLILTIICIIKLFINYDEFWPKFSVFTLSALLINLSILKLRKPKILLTTDSEGFTYSNKKIKWNEILVYKSVTTEERYSYKKIALGTKSRGIIEIDISNLNIGIKDFLKIIELNKNVA
ncbi:hypothetical protein LX95_02901 [Mesonia algae]|uniref:Uncharacterized protein n=1 Tax=Mesonia algae TaxID=213248 RepID=A0A2W7HYI5_9FLAO|nr:hypothetical protein [Mesonia algae]PZW36988.1 hypothetical protein LX95_02901 [Mesonia algae]